MKGGWFKEIVVRGKRKFDGQIMSRPMRWVDKGTDQERMLDGEQTKREGLMEV